jgi:hypothetical protein
MDTRYQVFVSSTFTDLKEERQAVVQALLNLEHFPAGMEAFPASDDDAWTLIRGVIDDSDYYVLVIGGRYGSTNDEGLGYTEMEFDYAAQKEKPILAFLHEAPGQIPSGKTDQNDVLRKKLAKFQAKVKSGHHVKYWNTPSDLQAKVIQSISAETKRNPREGWVRAGRASDPVVVEKLRQEIDRLRSEVDAARNSPPNDAAKYAGGDDRFEVEIEYNLRGYGEDEGTTKVSVTWDDIFYELGPMLVEEASERRMQARLSAELWKLEPDLFGNQEPRKIEVTTDSFETIKVQLLALGLIRKSDRKHVPSDTNKYWSLTPFGETSMMKLRAIPKPALS